MTLALRPPCRSAVGVDWCENFNRNFIGIRQNQGTTHGTSPNVVTLTGEWASFPGNAAAFIEYPHLVTDGRTQITLGCWVYEVTNLGAWQALISQYNPPVAAQREFLLDIVSGTIRFYLRIGGANRTASAVVTNLFNGPNSLIGTWTSGGKLQIYYNGALAGESPATYTGTINDSGQTLRIGQYNDSFGVFQGLVRFPFVEFRHWNAQEVLQYYNKRLFT